MEIKLEEVTHVLKAYKYYLMQITTGWRRRAPAKA